MLPQKLTSENYEIIMLDPRIVLTICLQRASSKSWHGDSNPSLTTMVRDLGMIIMRLMAWLGVSAVACFALYFVLASPPMHLVYDVAQPAGPSTIYIPGKSEYLPILLEVC